MAGFTDPSGKIAFVTGGATGMGEGIAEAMCALGRRVAIAEIQSASDRELAIQSGKPDGHTESSILSYI